MVVIPLPLGIPRRQYTDQNVDVGLFSIQNALNYISVDTSVSNDKGINRLYIIKTVWILLTILYTSFYILEIDIISFVERLDWWILDIFVSFYGEIL